MLWGFLCNSKPDLICKVEDTSWTSFNPLQFSLTWTVPNPTGCGSFLNTTLVPAQPSMPATSLRLFSLGLLPGSLYFLFLWFAQADHRTRGSTLTYSWVFVETSFIGVISAWTIALNCKRIESIWSNANRVGKLGGPLSSNCLGLSSLIAMEKNSSEIGVLSPEILWKALRQKVDED